VCSSSAEVRSGAPPAATVARLGGDEFAVLLAAPTDPSRPTARNLRRGARRGTGPRDSGARGPGPRHAEHPGEHRRGHDAYGHLHSDLLRHADTAMYAAKNAGGRCSATRLSWTAAAERFALVADLRAPHVPTAAGHAPTARAGPCTPDSAAALGPATHRPRPGRSLPSATGASPSTKRRPSRPAKAWEGRCVSESMVMLLTRNLDPRRSCTHRGRRQAQ
jgi:hypothetical protein